jgi:hypothetical protein
MARKIHRGEEIFGKTKKLFQDREGSIHQGASALPVDGLPRYDLESGPSEVPKDKLLKESLDIAGQILQLEQVLPLADLNYTYRELLAALKEDPRFSVTSGQLVSLPSVGNPADIFFRKIARMKKGRGER